MSTSLRQSTFEGLIWGIGGKVILVFANFAVLMVTSRALTPAEFGVFAAATIFTDLSWALATSTVGVALVQRVDLSDDEIHAGFLAFVALGLGVAGAVAATAGLLERGMNSPGLQPVLWVLALVIPFRVLAGFYGALLQRRLDMKYYQLTQNLPQILGGAGVTVGAALAGFGVWALVAGYAIATILEFGLTAGRARMRPQLPRSLTSLRPLLKIGGASAANRLTSFAATNLDRVIVGVALGAASLALYSRAYSLMMVPVKLVGLAINRVMLPIFAKMQGDELRLRAAICTVIDVQTVFFVPLSVGFVISAPLIVHIVLGPAWTDVVVPAQIFFVALIARLGSVAPEVALVAIGEAWTATRIQSVYAAAVILLGGLGALAGLIGIASGVTAGLLIFYLLLMRMSVVRFGVPVKRLVACHARGIAIAAIGALVIPLVVTTEAWLPAWLATDHILPIGAYWTALLLVAAVSPAYLLGVEVSALRSQAISKIYKLVLR